MSSLKTTKQTAYSLWLRFSEPHESVFGEMIIKECSNLNVLTFKPHVTLFGMIYTSQEFIIETISKMIKNLKVNPFEIILNPTNVEDVFRLSNGVFYIKCSLNDKLIEYNNYCRKAFNRLNDRKYNPHMSLVYWDVNQSNNDKGTKAYNVLKNGYFKENNNIKCKIESIEIWDTTHGRSQDAIKKWKLIKSFKL